MTAIKIEALPTLQTPANPRILYSFPHRLGAGRICTTAWYQVAETTRQGGHLNVFTASIARALPRPARVFPTLSRFGLRMPIKFIGRTRACRWHDHRTARWLAAHADEVDVVHGWPLASLETLRTARRLGIPALLERPNAHTATAYAEAAREARLVGVELPRGHDHRPNPDYLAREEAEYREADLLLCPSEHVRRTFLDRGFPGEKLLRHHYGFDPVRFRPGLQDARGPRGLVLLYAGVGEPRKGLHYALEAWLKSGAQARGKFLVCGELLPGYARRLAPLLAHPSVQRLGHCANLPERMREADLFTLPSVEEGSALVTYEARASGCVLLVSDAAGAPCQAGENALVHPARDVETLTRQITSLDRDRDLLARLRTESLRTVDGLSWAAAGKTLLSIYQAVGRGRTRGT